MLDDKELPVYAQLCVQVEDSGYSKPAFLAKNRAKTNRVTITRARTNRTFYRPPAQTARAGGPPTWYGAPVALPDPTTGPRSDATATTAMRRLRGQTYQVQLEAWPNMRLPGKCKPAPLPMRLYPFTLVRLRLLNAPGELAFQRPLWRMGMGERRRELSVLDSFQADQRRYDMEHFFRFGKQRLLLDRYPTPDAEHQEQWWRLVHLAYRQLGVARPVAQAVPRPWATAPAASPQQPLLPTHVQRDFGRIIRQFGTPAAAPKRRGNSAGRPKGMVWPHRPNAAVVYQAQT